MRVARPGILVVRGSTNEGALSHQNKEEYILLTNNALSGFPAVRFEYQCAVSLHDVPKCFK